MSNVNEPTALERISAPILLRLAAVPRWLFVIVLAGFVVAGLAISGPIGGAFLVVVALFLAWLAALGWAHYSWSGRLLRVAVVLLVAYIAAAKLLGFGGA